MEPALRQNPETGTLGSGIGGRFRRRSCTLRGCEGSDELVHLLSMNLILIKRWPDQHNLDIAKAKTEAVPWTTQDLHKVSKIRRLPQSGLVVYAGVRANVEGVLCRQQQCSVTKRRFSYLHRCTVIHFGRLYIREILTLIFEINKDIGIILSAALLSKKDHFLPMTNAKYTDKCRHVFAVFSDKKM